jgi:PhnB protein
MAKAKPVPEGYHTLTPFLCIRNCAEAIAFYGRAFGAQELSRFSMPDGKVAHAELRIGDSRLMVAEEMPATPDAPVASPSAVGGTTVGLHVYVPDADALFARATAAGAAVRRPMQDQFYGDRSGTVEDPYGHVWTLSTHVEDVSAEETMRRMAAMSRG